MCGIAGVVHRDGRPAEREVLERMADALEHRGPDSGGVFTDRFMGMSMRRLRVIDLDGGEQPIATADGRLHIVFNGEIYNYRELRDELQAAGHSFGTESDTEVLLHAWLEYGPGMFARLNGMYAFAIWDRESSELILARDRMGIKPLFYAESAGAIVFASETAALFASGSVTREVDLELVPALVLLQYLPSPRTLFRGVRSLPPGTWMRVGEEGIEQHRFAPAAPETRAMSAGEAGEELLHVLRSAVRYRMIADVPLGALLSGGLDSSLVVALMAETSSRPVQTFSVGFEASGDFDELHHARRVSQALGTDHHEVVFSDRDLDELLPRVFDRMQAPILDPALLPTFVVSQLARTEVTVVLTGEGADELFGGYRRYRWQHMLGGLPPWVLRLLPRLGGHRVRQALGALGTRDPVANHLAWSRSMAGSVAEWLFHPELLGASERLVHGCFAAHEACAEAPVTAAMRLDQTFWMSDGLLAKVDRMSMAHSLEARVPYLDGRVVDLANAMPLSLKLRRLTGKWMLRQVAAGLVPETVIRRPKHGFDLPLDEWFRGRLRGLAADSARTLAGAGVVNTEALETIIGDHVAGRDDFGLLLFSMVVLARLIA